METDDVRQDVWIWGGLKELSLLASLQLALGVGTGAAPQSDGTSSLLDPDTCGKRPGCSVSPGSLCRGKRGHTAVDFILAFLCIESSLPQNFS